MADNVATTYSQENAKEAFWRWLTKGGTQDPGVTGPSVSGAGATKGTPALTLGTTNAAGSASTFVATDATVLTFDATAPTTQALGDAAAVGSATTAAHRDHKHAMPAISSYATVYPASAQNAVNASFTQINFDTVISQSANTPFSTGNKNFTAPVAGRLLITATVGIASAAYTNLVLSVYKNTAELQRGPQWSSGTNTTITLAIIVACAANDVFDIRIFQQSGGSDRAISVGSSGLGTHAEFCYLQ